MVVVVPKCRLGLAVVGSGGDGNFAQSTRIDLGTQIGKPGPALSTGCLDSRFELPALRI